MTELEVSLENRGILGMCRLEGWTETTATHGHDFGRGEFEQALRAPRDAETAALASAEREVGIGSWNDEVIDAPFVECFFGPTFRSCDFLAWYAKAEKFSPFGYLRLADGGSIIRLWFDSWRKFH